MNFLSKLSCEGAKLPYTYSVLKLSGSDCTRFLQGQTTNDVKQLLSGYSHYNALVDIAGRLESFFILHKVNSDFFLYCEKDQIEKIVTRLEKYLITEDVEISKLENDAYIYLGYEAYALALSSQEYGKGIFFGIPGFVTFQKTNLALPELSMALLDNLVVESGYGRLNQEVNLQKLINETFLETVAVSFTKGCFTGQETVSKIHNFRGPGYFPVLLSSLGKSLELGEFYVDGKMAGIIKTLNDKCEHAYALVLRDFRLDQSQMEIIFLDNNKAQVKVSYYSLAQKDRKSIAKNILEDASYLFTHENNLEKAKNLLKMGIHISPESPDLYESLGVILEREEKIQEAIDWMDKLSQIDPESVMAYTNKSLYLMKLGKIEEAEAAKATATVKSFAYYGAEAKKKNAEAEEEKKKEMERARRELMFKQVLEIDPEDALASFGMAEIYYERKEYDQALINVQQVLKTDPKYSVGYLLQGKIYEGMKNFAGAKDIYRKGIPVATSKGDMMPANEMQSRLIKLS